MARQTTIVLTDDLHGGPADHTVEFGFEGTDYEIDLNEENRSLLALFLEPYIQSARKARAERKARSAPVKSDRTELRSWARKNGWPDLPDKGRIPRPVIDAFESRGRA